MFARNKRLQYTVRVAAPNPGLQFGGPQGELATACGYFTQAVAKDDAGRKDMLFDIATEELSHLKVIGSIVAMRNKGAKSQLAEAVEEEVRLVPLTHRGRQPLAYDRPPLRWRPCADQFGRRAMERRLHRHHRRADSRSQVELFPQGKLPGGAKFTSVHFDLSKGDDVRGPWNEGREWQFDGNPKPAVDGGDGTVQVNVPKADLETLKAMASRTASNPDVDPTTGADLGAGQETTTK